MEDFFEYLDELRESGVTNMYGGTPYLEAEFGLGRREARDVLVKWMQSFDPAKSASERAAALSA